MAIDLVSFPSSYIGRELVSLCHAYAELLFFERLLLHFETIHLDFTVAFFLLWFVHELQDQIVCVDQAEDVGHDGQGTPQSGLVRVLPVVVDTDRAPIDVLARQKFHHIFNNS